MAFPDRTPGRGGEIRPGNPPSGLTKQQSERLVVVRGVLDRIYESDEFAEAIARQASGKAEIVYDTIDPNSPNRQPLFTDGQVVLRRNDGVAYGFHRGIARGVDISPSVEVRGGRRALTTSLWTSGLDQVGGVLRLYQVGGYRRVELAPREALGVLETVVNVFSEDVTPTQAPTPTQ